MRLFGTILKVNRPRFGESNHESKDMLFKHFTWVEKGKWVGGPSQGNGLKSWVSS